MLDLSKAYDCLDRGLVITELEKNCLRKNVQKSVLGGYFS